MRYTSAWTDALGDPAHRASTNIDIALEGDYVALALTINRQRVHIAFDEGQTQRLIDALTNRLIELRDPTRSTQ